MIDETSEVQFWAHPLCKWLKNSLNIPTLFTNLTENDHSNQLISNSLHFSHLINNRNSENDCETSDLAVTSRTIIDEQQSTILIDSLRYIDLCDASILNAMLLYIDVRPVYSVIRCSHEFSGRVSNLALFWRNIQLYYKEVLQQLIVMPLPDLLSIARHPTAEGSGKEMKKVLLLLLGCAVQSDKKEEFVSRIKELELSLQQAIVEQIQKITSNAECVLNVQALELDPEDQATIKVLHQLQRVVKERDGLAQTVLELNQEQESDTASGSSVCNGDVCSRKLPESQQHARCTSPSSSERQHHLAVELAATKAELRKLRNEHDEKQILLAETRESAQFKDQELGRLQQERIELLRDARAAKDYRDEVDCLQMKLSKCERLEADNTRLKEKLSEMDFFRSRVDELRQENFLLLETRQVLESQVDSWRKRAQEQTETESELLHTQQALQEIKHQLQMERVRLEQQVEETCEKESQQTALKRQVSELQQQLSQSSTRSTSETLLNGGGSLGDQLSQSDRTQVLHLQLENQKLKSQLDDQSFTSQKSYQDSQTEEQLRIAESQNSKLTSEINRLEKQLKSVETELNRSQTEIHSQKQLLRQNYDDSVKQMSNSQTEMLLTMQEECQKKINSLTSELDVSRSNCENLSEENHKLSSETVNLHEQLKTLQNEQIDQEEQRITTTKQIQDLEEQKRCLEKEKIALKTKLSAADLETEQLRIKTVSFESGVNRQKELQQKLNVCENELSEALASLKQMNNQLQMEKARSNKHCDELIKVKTLAADLQGRIMNVCRSFAINNDNEAEFDVEVISMLQINKQTINRLQMNYNDQSMKVSTLLNENDQLKSSMDQLRSEIDNKNQFNTNQCGVEHERAKHLQNENQSLREQISHLQERIRKNILDVEEKDKQTIVLTEDLHTLKRENASHIAANGELARLQVALSNAELQSDTLKRDNQETSRQIKLYEKQTQEQRESLEKQQKLHQELLADHEHLQALHEQLNLDYENIKQTLSELKVRNRDKKNLESQVSDLTDRCNSDRSMVAELKLIISKEKSIKDACLKQQAVLQNEYSELKRLFEQLKTENQTLANDARKAHDNNRELRAQQQSNELHLNQAADQLGLLQEQLSRKEMEVVKHAHKSDAMHQLNDILKEECRILMKQNAAMTEHNQHLVVQSMRQKDQHHSEGKELQQQLNDAHRVREKLEEKIMDQYKSMDNHSYTKKTQKESNTFMKKAARALLPNKSSTRRTRATPSSTEESSGAFSGDEGHIITPSGSQHENGKPEFSRNAHSTRTKSEQPLDREDTIRSDLGKKSACSSTSSSARHTGSSLSEQMNHEENRSQILQSRISWNGSERAVDVPSQSSGAVPPPLPPLRHSMAIEELPVPPRNRAPPPYPGAANNAGPVPVVAANQRRAAPPPYPGMSRSTTPKRPVADTKEQQKGAVGTLCSPRSIISETNGSGQFTPRDASTPKLQRYKLPQVADNLSPLRTAIPPSPLINNAEHDKSIVNIGSGQNQHRRNSIYDNLTDLSVGNVNQNSIGGQEYLEPNPEDISLVTHDGHVITGNNQSALNNTELWYEHGCV